MLIDIVEKMIKSNAGRRYLRKTTDKTNNLPRFTAFLHA